MIYIETLKRNIENLKLIGKVNNMYDYIFSEDESINENMKETLSLLNEEVMNILKGVDLDINYGDQLELRFDEEPNDQMELFNDNHYVGITDEEINQAKACVNQDLLFQHQGYYFAPLVTFNQSWFNHFNGLLYIELRKLNKIKYNKLARLWLFYSLCIVGDERFPYDLNLIGYTYITYVSNGRRFPIKDYLFWDWVEDLLNEKFN